MNSKDPYMIDLTSLHGDDNSHSCGYCKKNGSFSVGFTAKCLKPETYKNLADSGIYINSIIIY